MCSERHRYEVDVDLEVPSAQATVVKMTGRGKRVLDLGAGPGAVAKVLREQGCRVVGLEKDPSAIPILREHCEKVVEADLGDPSWVASLRGDDPFEVVVIADVLEHLVEPEAVLRSVKPLLASNGCVVASLPHAGHASVHACLFHEDFRYGDWGLLDRTHIRHFGLKNMQALFESAGYEIVEAMLVLLRPEDDVQFAALWDALPGQFKSAVRLNTFSEVYQVVVKARPSAMPGSGLQLRALSVTSSAHTVVLTGPRGFETARSRSKDFLAKILGKNAGKKVWDQLSRAKRSFFCGTAGVPVATQSLGGEKSHG
ncbi:MAG: class I SAM-dependent methyltransferase [Candidatus Omnitrophica bacterium]|nr:class I SAM-dependent methyltransferase [Candidatus Omnitrophota bacterium]